MKESLVSRDQALLDRLHYYSDSIRLMTQEQINIRATMESKGKRQCELTKVNGKILNWAMTTMSGKKKVPLPNIQISDMVPYIIVPPDVQNPTVPYSQPPEPEPEPIPFYPPRNKTSRGTSKISSRSKEKISLFSV